MDQFLAVLSNPSVLTVVGLVLEAVFRLVPTEKPLSVLHLVSRVTGALATFLDKVLPQAQKPPGS